jgi:metal-responsive CopG/Arc/MetJ family transcriptional regulator
MKTAISLPDRLYAEAEKTAQSMGIPRSQLFAKALEEFIQHHQREKITEQLNAVYGNFNQEELKEISEVNLESLRNLTQNDTW